LKPLDVAASEDGVAMRVCCEPDCLNIANNHDGKAWRCLEHHEAALVAWYEGRDDTVSGSHGILPPDETTTTEEAPMIYEECEVPDVVREAIVSALGEYPLMEVVEKWTAQQTGGAILKIRAAISHPTAEAVCQQLERAIVQKVTGYTLITEKLLRESERDTLNLLLEALGNCGLTRSNANVELLDDYLTGEEKPPPAKKEKKKRRSRKKAAKKKDTGEGEPPAPAGGTDGDEATSPPPPAKKPTKKAMREAEENLHRMKLAAARLDLDRALLEVERAGYTETDAITGGPDVVVETAETLNARAREAYSESMAQTKWTRSLAAWAAGRIHEARQNKKRVYNHTQAMRNEATRALERREAYWLEHLKLWFGRLPPEQRTTDKGVRLEEAMVRLEEYTTAPGYYLSDERAAIDSLREEFGTAYLIAAGVIRERFEFVPRDHPNHSSGREIAFGLLKDRGGLILPGIEHRDEPERGLKIVGLGT